MKMGKEKGRKNTQKNGEKGLKKQSFSVINLKMFCGRGEHYIKNGEKGLKNASFWVIDSKNFRGGGGGLPTPPAVGEKN